MKSRKKLKKLSNKKITKMKSINLKLKVRKNTKKDKSNWKKTREMRP